MSCFVPFLLDLSLSGELKDKSPAEERCKTETTKRFEQSSSSPAALKAFTHVFPVSQKASSTSWL